MDNGLGLPFGQDGRSGLHQWSIRLVGQFRRAGRSVGQVGRAGRGRRGRRPAPAATPVGPARAERLPVSLFRRGRPGLDDPGQEVVCRVVPRLGAADVSRTGSVARGHRLPAAHQGVGVGPCVRADRGDAGPHRVPGGAVDHGSPRGCVPTGPVHHRASLHHHPDRGAGRAGAGSGGRRTAGHPRRGRSRRRAGAHRRGTAQRPTPGIRSGATTWCSTSSPTRSTCSTVTSTGFRRWRIRRERARWQAVSTEAFERARRSGLDGVLRDYAGTNPAEFFAVATEVFFTTPSVLLSHEAELYDVLRSFYRQDPAGRD